MIPKKIWTAWFGDPMPTGIRKCIESQHIPGYEHFVLDEKTVRELKYIPQYVITALDNKKWVKATDYLRAWILYTFGGIFLDADMEVLPGKNFDDLLHMELFAGREENGFVGYSLVGSRQGHPLWEEYFKQVNEKFHPLDGLNFESSMEIFTHLMDGRIASSNPAPLDITVLNSDYFFPYNHQTGIINVTPNTVTFHHFWKTWTDKFPNLLPKVSIIIPQLGRPEGLQRCLDSIDRLYYPKHLIETIVIAGDETVPEKVKQGYEQSKGDVIVYASNDIEFTPESLYNAIRKDTGLTAFNTGEVYADQGNICEHFLIWRNLIKDLENGEIFSTDFHHVGCDNWLWAQAKKLGRATRAENAVVKHNHFTQGQPMDEVYEKGWKNAEADRELLKQKLYERFT
jgi:hypothetical protein